MRVASKDIEAGLKPLIDKGFFLVASGVLADCQQDAIPERETERETETEKPASKTKNSTSTPKVDVPENVPASLWVDFLAVRNAKKAALTETALEGIKREAAKAGKTLPEALTICCERGWAGFNAKWLDKDVVVATGSPDWLKSRTA